MISAKNGKFLAAGFLTVSLGLWLRSLALVREPWYDEYYSLVESSTNLQTLREGDQPPFYFFLLALARAQDSVWEARVFTLLISAVFLVSLLLFLRKFGHQGALLACLVGATAPMLTRYGVEIRAYGLLVLLSLIAVQLTDYLRRKPDSPPAFLTLLVTLIAASWTHAVGVFLAPAAVGIWILGSRGSKPQYFRWISLLFVPVMATGTWLLYYRLDKKHRYGWIPELSWDKSTAELFKFVTGSGGIPSFPSPCGDSMQPAVTASLVLFTLAIGIAAWKGREGRLYLWGAGLYLAQMVFVSAVYEGIILGRTLLPMFGFLLFFFAASFEGIKERRIRLLVGALLIAFSALSVWRWAACDGAHSPEQWNRVASVLKQNATDSDIILAEYRIHPIPLFHLPDFKGEMDFYMGPGDVDVQNTDPAKVVYLLAFAQSNKRGNEELFARFAERREGTILYKDRLATLWRYGVERRASK